MELSKTLALVTLLLSVAACGKVTTSEDLTDPATRDRKSADCAGYNSQGTAVVQSVSKVGDNWDPVNGDVSVRFLFTPANPNESASAITMKMNAVCARDEGFSRGSSHAETAWISQNNSCAASSITLTQPTCM